jgi:hypothetical protein
MYARPRALCGTIEDATDTVMLARRALEATIGNESDLLALLPSVSQGRSTPLRFALLGGADIGGAAGQVR